MKGEGTLGSRQPAVDVADVSQQIRAWRDRTGKSFRDLAEESNVPRAYVAAAAQGVRVPYWAIRRLFEVIGS